MESRTDTHDQYQQSTPAAAGERADVPQEGAQPAQQHQQAERQNPGPAQDARQGESAAADPTGQPGGRPPQYERGEAGTTQPHENGSQAWQQAPPTEGNGSVQRSDAQGEGMLPYHEAEGYKRRWETIQASFVDDPRACCEQADALVIEILDRMTQIRQEHRSHLRSALEQGGGDTEGLRQAMQQYRSFFGGLLKA